MTLRKDLEEYVKKLEKWKAPMSYGRASGGVTKGCILQDLRGLLNKSNED